MKSRHRFFWVLLIMLMTFGLLVAACQAAEEPAEPAEEPAAEEPAAEEPAAEEPAPEEPAEKKVAVLIWTQEFDNLNPYYTNMWFSSITQQFWNAWAWDFDDANAPHPVLVAEIPSVENEFIEL